MDSDYVVAPFIVSAAAIVVIWLGVRRMLSPALRVRRTGRKVIERIVISIVVAFAAAVAISSSYNALVLHHFWAANRPGGNLVAVNGHNMRIDCTGNGSPTIVLDAGLGNDGLIWAGVQPVLSKTTRVCSYDRAGFGWSDAVPGPRDADHIAGELHELLHHAGVAGPVVLMGHSISGIYMRDYATRYPANVVGMVFVDASTPLQDQNPAMKAGGSKGPPPWLIRFAMIAGGPRLIGMCSPHAKGATTHTRKLQAEDLCRLRYSALAAEAKSFHQSGQETIHSGPYGALPILILSHDPARLVPKQNATKQDVDRQNAWSQMQEDMKKLSTRSRRIIARGSTHYVLLDRADLIDQEVPLFIEQIRGTTPQPINYGSTIIE